MKWSQRESSGEARGREPWARLQIAAWTELVATPLPVPPPQGGRERRGASLRSANDMQAAEFADAHQATIAHPTSTSACARLRVVSSAGESPRCHPGMREAHIRDLSPLLQMDPGASRCK